MAGAVKRRIEYAKKHGARIANKGQNDTVVARPLLLQLDEESIQGHEDVWVWDIVAILEAMFGKENILGFSVHRDETNVHVHVLFVPCYETQKGNGKVKCTLSQTQFFKNPRQLAGMHKHIRKELLNKGYNIQKDNKPIEEMLAGYTDKRGVFHQQGLTPDQLKAITDRKKQLDEKERDIMLSRAELDTLAEAMADVQEKAKATQESLENNMRVFECQQADFENEKANLRTQMEAVLEEKEKVKKMHSDADGMLEKAYAVSDICKKIIAQEHTLNKDFLDFLESYGNRTGKPYKRAVEKLYRKFHEERRSKMSHYDSELEELLQLRQRQRTADDIVRTFNSREEKNDTAGFDFF